jgi:hypothetical protein
MAGESSRWKRGGPSPNPSGRCKAAVYVSKLVREATDDGRELVKTITSIARGEISTMSSERSRTWALEWLADRAFGRPVQSLELSLGEAPRRPSFDGFTIEELEILAKLDRPIEEREADERERKALHTVPALASVALRNPDDNPNDKDGNAAT